LSLKRKELHIAIESPPHGLFGGCHCGWKTNMNIVALLGLFFILQIIIPKVASLLTSSTKDEHFNALAETEDYL